MLAEIFIKKSIEMGRENNRFIRSYLENQLGVVQQQLNQSDYQLKKFRNTHIVGLDRETQDIMARLDRLDRNVNELTLNKEELELLLSKLDPTVSDFEMGTSTRYIYSQISAQPVFENDPEMIIARQELNELYQQRSDLHQRGFPELNPMIMEIGEEVALVEEKIYRLAKAKVKELETLISDQKVQMDEFHEELSTHPEEELRLIKLTRQRRANEEIYELLLKRYKEAQISEAVASENVSILDPAIPPSQPMNAGKKKKAVFGFIFGLFLGVGVSLILEIADKSIKTQEDVKRYLKLPILGVIPNVKFDNYEIQDSEKAKSISSQIVTHDYSPTPVGEAYRSLRTGLLFSKRIGNIRSLVISSVFPGEGKSFTAANLAITLAQQKSKTLLIDADLRRGVLHNNFSSPKKPGLTNYLTGVVPLEGILNETYVPNLSLITCGSLIPNPSELLGSIKMKRFIEGISKRFDFTVFDTPPLIAATDAVVLGTIVDGVTLVIRAGKTGREEAQRKLELFNNVQAKIVGIILNGAGIEIAHEGYSYYSY
jgi:tyrosine-protein kinase Etk/Wzc